MKLLQDRFNHKAGTEVFMYRGHDYGLTRDDRNFTGEEHYAVTLNSDGSGPFFTVPESKLSK